MVKADDGREDKKMMQPTNVNVCNTHDKQDNIIFKFDRLHLVLI